MSDSTWTVERCEYHPLYKPYDAIPDNSQDKKLIFARRHSREKSSKRRPHCKSCSSRIDRDTASGKGLEAIHEDLDKLVRGFGKVTTEEVSPVESSSASGAAGSGAAAAGLMHSVPVVFATKLVDPLTAAPGGFGRSGYGDLRMAMAMPISTANSSADQLLGTAIIQPSNGPPANDAPAQATAQAPAQGTPAQGSPTQHQQQQAEKEEKKKIEGDEGGDDLRARAEAAEARAKAAEARAEAAERRIEELKKDKADDVILHSKLGEQFTELAHRLEFQQRIFSMELSGLEKDLVKLEADAQEDDAMIKKMMDQNEWATGVIEKYQKERRAAASAVAGSVAVGSTATGSAAASAVAGSAVAGSAASSAAAGLAASRSAKNQKRAQSDNTVAPASKPAGLSAAAKGSHPPRKAGRLYDAPPIVGKHCSFCRQSDCAQGGNLNQCKAMTCMRLWSDRCIGRYAGDDTQKMCFHHAKCVHHDQTNCPDCVRNCMPAVYEPTD